MTLDVNGYSVGGPSTSAYTYVTALVSLQSLIRENQLCIYILTMPSHIGNR